MANDINRSSVTANLTDVYSKFLTDDVNLKFYNVRLTSEKLQADVSLDGRPVEIDGLPAAPEGLAQVFIAPTKYRYKSVFVNVQADGSSRMDEVFFIDPDKVTPKFPTFSALQSDPRWSGLVRLLKNSRVTSAKAWNAMGDQPRAGLLNLYSKMAATTLDGGQIVTDLVQSVDQFLPARIFTRTDPKLIELVGAATQIFHTVSGALHSFDPPWTAVVPDNSWKTFDSAGNLQLTFATDGKGNFMADIDIDDHQGIEHAADVLKHVFTGKDTHPYDIHEILIFFQHLDPGYSLA